MTRRPAPTPLRLHHGPTPPRSWTKFVLPALPRPAFYPPKTEATASEAPNQRSLPLLDTTGRRGSIGGESSSSPVGSRHHGRHASFESFEGVPCSSAPSPVDSPMSVPSSSRQVRGPWDRSRDFSESHVNVDAVLKPPQAAVVNSVPTVVFQPSMFW